MEDKDQPTKGLIGVVICDVTRDKQRWDKAVNLMITNATCTVYMASLSINNRGPKINP